MNALPLSAVLRELDTTEAFLEHFGIAYSRGVIDVNRLLILRRFHDALAEHDLDGVEELEALALARSLLQAAYNAFAQPRPTAAAPSPAPQPAPPAAAARTFVPLDAIIGSQPRMQR